MQHIDLYKITPTSPLRYFLQGLDSSDDSSDEPETGLTGQDVREIQEGTVRAKLVIVFKNPFKRNEHIRQNLYATALDFEGRQGIIHFHPEEGSPFFFSRGHQARWSKIDLVLTNSEARHKTIAIFRQYVPNNQFDCCSLNGKLFLQLVPITQDEKSSLSSRAARCLFPPSEPALVTMSVREANLGDPSSGQCVQAGLVTKIKDAHLRLQTE